MLIFKTHSLSWMFFYSPLFKRLAKLRYSSAVAIEHEIDRFTDFLTLVHGEFLYSVISSRIRHHLVRRCHRRAGQGERGGPGHPLDLFW